MPRGYECTHTHTVPLLLTGLIGTCTSISEKRAAHFSSHRYIYTGVDKRDDQQKKGCTRNVRLPWMGARNLSTVHYQEIFTSCNHKNWAAMISYVRVQLEAISLHLTTQQAVASCNSQGSASKLWNRVCGGGTHLLDQMTSPQAACSIPSTMLLGKSSYPASHENQRRCIAQELNWNTRWYSTPIGC